jgi:hypothetical protein
MNVTSTYNGNFILHRRLITETAKIIKEIEGRGKTVSEISLNGYDPKTKRYCAASVYTGDGEAHLIALASP